MARGTYPGQSKPSRITGKKLVKKYSIKAKAPMKTVKVAIPGKVAKAKLEYDIAKEEQTQITIARDIQAVEQQMVNEKNRFQMTNKRFVKGESQLINDSQNYSMLKRQQEQLQRQQQSSSDRLSTLTTKKILSVSPVKTASKAFRGINKSNPMKSSKKYVTVLPGSASSPLGNLDSTFKNVLGSAANLIPTIPQAHAMPLGAVGGGIGKVADEAASTIFAMTKAFGGKQSSFVATSAASKRMENRIIREEGKKAVALAKSQGETDKATLNGIRSEAESKTRMYLGWEKGNVADSKELVVKKEIGSEWSEVTKDPYNQNKVVKTWQTKRNAPEEYIKDLRVGLNDPSIEGLTVAEIAAKEKFATEMFSLIAKDKIKPDKKGSGRFFSTLTTKKMAATGTVLGAGTMPLYPAYAEQPKQNKSDPFNTVISFGQDFYKGASDFGSNFGKMLPTLKFGIIENRNKHLKKLKHKGKGKHR